MLAAELCVVSAAEGSLREWPTCPLISEVHVACSTVLVLPTYVAIEPYLVPAAEGPLQEWGFRSGVSTVPSCLCNICSTARPATSDADDKFGDWSDKTPMSVPAPERPLQEWLIVNDVLTVPLLVQHLQHSLQPAILTTDLATTTLPVITR